MAAGSGRKRRGVGARGPRGLAERARRALGVVRAGVIAACALAVWVAPSSHAQTCDASLRTPFAGHAFPLVGDLVEESLSLANPFPSWNGDGLGEPTFLTAPPDGSDRLFLTDRAGRVLAIPNRPDVTQGDLRTVLDLSAEVDDSFTEEGLLGLAFHPDFATNGLFFVSYTAQPWLCVENARCALIVRHAIDPTDPDRALPGSRFVVLEIDRPGSAEFHNGGTIAFGGDGYLYASIGDQNERELAQDTSSLRGKLLRIDVDAGTERSPGIPPDNPFGNAVYHYGLRNPWRHSFDRERPDDLWIADVGATLREEVNWLPAGTGGGLNFGWPDCEGDVDLTTTGCTPEQRAPDIVYDHTSSRIGVIGGFVYRGSISSLQGSYVFGDFGGEIFTWDRTSRDAGTGRASIERVLQPGGFLGTFGEDAAGEIYTWDYFGARAPRRIAASDPTPGDPFPTQLSQTGLFSDVSSLTPAPGLIEYDVSSVLWSDGAAKRRWIALPGLERISFAADGAWSFPVGTAIVKHFELEQPGAPAARVETRVFLRQIDRWVGFTYRWNAQGSDATLLYDGVVDEIPLAGGGAQPWNFPSPAECLSCHGLAPGRVLGVRTAQLNHDFPTGPLPDNQLEAWSCLGLFDTDIGDPAVFDHWVDVDDPVASIATRARDYLQVNCATCHQPGGTASSLDLRNDVLLGEMNAIGVPPVRGTLGLPEPFLIDPGAHANSIVSVRAESSDPAERMARGTLLEHVAATSVLADWIDGVLFDTGSGAARLDSDEDGVVDAIDNCPAVPNASQANADGDGLGDPCDPDQMADLIPLTSLPARAQIGGTVNLASDVSNLGGLRSQTAQVRFHLSVDTTLDPDDVVVGECFVPDMGSGATQRCTVSDAPIADPGSGAGDYHWIACADALGVVDEGDEANNCAVRPVLIPEPTSTLLLATALGSVVAIAGLRRRARVLVDGRG